MKSLKPKYDHHSCVLIVRQRRVMNDEENGLEPDLAMGWIIDDENYDMDSARQLQDALEQFGFTDGLARKV